MFKKLAALALLFLIALSILSYVLGSTNVALTGASTLFILLANFLGLYLIWKIIIQKKSIALAVAIIILKYPILGYLVIKIAKQEWFSSLGLILGFVSFIVYILLVAFLKQTKRI